MKKLVDVFGNPSGLDSMKNYAGDVPPSDLLVVLSRNRDSDLLTERNFETALAMLGGESEFIQVVSFGHWACGWIEYLCVVEKSEKEKVAQNIVSDLESYPILCEESYYEKERETADQIWRDCYSTQERIAYMRDKAYQFEFHSIEVMIGCVRGKYFSGYADGLIS